MPSGQNPGNKSLIRRQARNATLLFSEKNRLGSLVQKSATLALQFGEHAVKSLLSGDIQAAEVCSAEYSRHVADWVRLIGLPLPVRAGKGPGGRILDIRTSESIEDAEAMDELRKSMQRMRAHKKKPTSEFPNGFKSEASEPNGHVVPKLDPDPRPDDQPSPAS